MQQRCWCWAYDAAATPATTATPTWLLPRTAHSLQGLLLLPSISYECVEQCLYVILFQLNTCQSFTVDELGDVCQTGMRRLHGIMEDNRIHTIKATSEVLDFSSMCCHNRDVSCLHESIAATATQFNTAQLTASPGGSLYPAAVPFTPLLCSKCAL